MVNTLKIAPDPIGLQVSIICGYHHGLGRRLAMSRELSRPYSHHPDSPTAARSTKCHQSDGPMPPAATRPPRRRPIRASDKNAPHTRQNAHSVYNGNINWVPRVHTWRKVKGNGNAGNTFWKKHIKYYIASYFFNITQDLDGYMGWKCTFVDRGNGAAELKSGWIVTQKPMFSTLNFREPSI